jgi:transcriptional regulator with XRE-family HTH domain
MTIKDRAARYGVTVMTLWRWLNGRTRPEPRYVRRLRRDYPGIRLKGDRVK